jgi:hypothetical protein
MPGMRGTFPARIAGVRDPATAALYVLVGIGLALLGWLAVDRFRARPLERLVFSRGEAKPETSWTIAFIFTPRECPTRMELVERLNQVSDRRVVVRGIMLVDSRRFAGWHDVVAANQIGFPVRAVSPETGDAALQGLGGLPTPLLAVFDRQHRLRMITDLADDQTLEALLQEIAARAAQPVSPAEGPA